MNKFIALGLTLTLLLSLTGCKQKEEETAYGDLELIPSHSISQNVYDVLQEEWDAWNTLSNEKKLLSSSTPGYCQQEFENWNECEDFLGINIPNEMEECSWLEQATYTGMPIGYADAPRVTLTWYGTEDGHVEWMTANAGYRHHEVRLVVSATLYSDPADTQATDRGWSSELERQAYLSQSDTIQISSETTDGYFSKEAYVAQGYVLYHVNVVGDPNAQAQVEETFTQVIDTFFTFDD